MVLVVKFAGEIDSDPDEFADLSPKDQEKAREMAEKVITRRQFEALERKLEAAE